jgi:hypothetical protein
MKPAIGSEKNKDKGLPLFVFSPLCFILFYVIASRPVGQPGSRAPARLERKMSIRTSMRRPAFCLVVPHLQTLSVRIQNSNHSPNFTKSPLLPLTDSSALRPTPISHTRCALFTTDDYNTMMSRVQRSFENFALLQAASEGSAAAVRDALQSGADINATDNSGRTILTCALTADR